MKRSEKSPDDLDDALMVTVGDRDIRGGDDRFFRIAHGDAQARGSDRGNVIARITGSHGGGYRDIKIAAQGLQALAFIHAGGGDLKARGVRGR